MAINSHSVFVIFGVELIFSPLLQNPIAVVYIAIVIVLNKVYMPYCFNNVMSNYFSLTIQMSHLTGVKVS